MKHIFVWFVGIFAVGCAVAAEPVTGALIAVSFPKSPKDLTFSQRMDLLTDGYAAFDTVFENGVCVKNCPYVGMTVQEFDRKIAQVAQEVQQDINAVNQQNTANANASPSPVSDSSTVQPQGVSQSQSQDLNQQPPTTVSQNGTLPPVPPQQQNPAAGQPVQPVAPNNVQTSQSQNLSSQSPVVLQSVTGTNIPTSCPLNLPSVRVSSEMGPRWGRRHNGIDLAVPMKTPIYAAADGVVFFKGIETVNGLRKTETDLNVAYKGYGRLLVLKHERNYYTLYGHLTSWVVSGDQRVKAGQLIGYSGTAGTGPHLHYEVLKNGWMVNGGGATPVDPRQITQCPWNPARRR